MIIEISLQKILLSAPDFSEYAGGNAFRFQEKIYQKRGKAIGSGVYGEVFCFEADDHTKLAVKSELMFYGEYSFGNDFQQEANWYQKIYGLGVFSGNVYNCSSPHYILMPYFEGKTLYAFPYTSTKDVFLCWVKTANAVKQLHEQHHAIHGDLKSDNVIMGKRVDQKLSDIDHEQVFVIDFGFATKIGLERNIDMKDTDENRTHYTQYPPEIFTLCHKKKQLAHPAQDIYSLGILLSNMYALFLDYHYLIDLPTRASETINDIKKNLTRTNPTKRWPIAKAIFMIVATFFSQVPKALWTKIAMDEMLNKMNVGNFMNNIWEVSAKVAIHMRLRELEEEQKLLEKSGKKSKRKEHKINGLKLLQSDIRIHDPKALGIIISHAKIKFPDLTVGIFSRRTKTLIDELTELAPVFH